MAPDTRTPLERLSTPISAPSSIDRMTQTSPAQKARLAEQQARADAYTLDVLRSHFTLLRNIRIKDGTPVQKAKLRGYLLHLKQADVRNYRWIEELTAHVVGQGLDAPQWADNPSVLPADVGPGEITTADIEWLKHQIVGKKPRKIHPDDVRHLAELAAKAKGTNSSEARLIDSQYPRIADYWAKQADKENADILAGYVAPDLSDVEEHYAHVAAGLMMSSPEMEQELSPNVWNDLDRREDALTRFAATSFREMQAAELEPFEAPTQPEREVIARPPTGGEVAKANVAKRIEQRQEERDKPTPLERIGIER